MHRLLGRNGLCAVVLGVLFLSSGVVNAQTGLNDMGEVPDIPDAVEVKAPDKATVSDKGDTKTQDTCPCDGMSGMTLNSCLQKNPQCYDCPTRTINMAGGKSVTCSAPFDAAGKQIQKFGKQCRQTQGSCEDLTIDPKEETEKYWKEQIGEIEKIQKGVWETGQNILSNAIGDWISDSWFGDSDGFWGGVGNSFSGGNDYGTDIWNNQPIHYTPGPSPAPSLDVAYNTNPFLNPEFNQFQQQFGIGQYPVQFDAPPGLDGPVTPGVSMQGYTQDQTIQELLRFSPDGVSASYNDDLITDTFKEPVLTQEDVFGEQSPPTGSVCESAGYFSTACASSVVSRTSCELIGVGCSAEAQMYNNNPGNWVKGNERWLAEHGIEVRPCGGRFLCFNSLEDGVKADMLQTKRWMEMGRDTPYKIMNTLSPAFENNTASMVGYISKELGIGPNERIDFNNPNVMAKFFEAKTFLETSQRLSNLVGGSDNLAQLYASATGVQGFEPVQIASAGVNVTTNQYASPLDITAGNLRGVQISAPDPVGAFFSGNEYEQGFSPAPQAEQPWYARVGETVQNWWNGTPPSVQDPQFSLSDTGFVGTQDVSTQPELTTDQAFANRIAQINPVQPIYNEDFGTQVWQEVPKDEWTSSDTGVVQTPQVEAQNTQTAGTGDNTSGEDLNNRVMTNGGDVDPVRNNALAELKSRADALRTSATQAQNAFRAFAAGNISSAELVQQVQQLQTQQARFETAFSSVPAGVLSESELATINASRVSVQNVAQNLQTYQGAIQGATAPDFMIRASLNSPENQPKVNAVLSGAMNSINTLGASIPAPQQQSSPVAFYTPSNNEEIFSEPAPQAPWYSRAADAVSNWWNGGSSANATEQTQVVLSDTGTIGLNAPVNNVPDPVAQIFSGNEYEQGFSPVALPTQNTPQVTASDADIATLFSGNQYEQGFMQRTEAEQDALRALSAQRSAINQVRELLDADVSALQTQLGNAIQNRGPISIGELEMGVPTGAIDQYTEAELDKKQAELRQRQAELQVNERYTQYIQEGKPHAEKLAQALVPQGPVDGVQAARDFLIAQKALRGDISNEIVSAPIDTSSPEAALKSATEINLRDIVLSNAKTFRDSYGVEAKATDQLDRIGLDPESSAFAISNVYGNQSQQQKLIDRIEQDPTKLPEDIRTLVQRQIDGGKNDPLFFQSLRMMQDTFEQVPGLNIIIGFPGAVADVFGYTDPTKGILFASNPNALNQQVGLSGVQIGVTLAGGSLLTQPVAGAVLKGTLNNIFDVPANTVTRLASGIDNIASDITRGSTGNVTGNPSAQLVRSSDQSFGNIIDNSAQSLNRANEALLTPQAQQNVAQRAVNAPNPPRSIETPNPSGSVQTPAPVQRGVNAGTQNPPSNVVPLNRGLQQNNVPVAPIRDADGIMQAPARSLQTPSPSPIANAWSNLTNWLRGGGDNAAPVVSRVDSTVNSAPVSTTINNVPVGQTGPVQISGSSAIGTPPPALQTNAQLARNVVNTPPPAAANQNLPASNRIGSAFDETPQTPAQNTTGARAQDAINEQDALLRLGDEGPAPVERQPRFARDVENRDPNLVGGDEARVVEREINPTVPQSPAEQLSWRQRINNYFFPKENVPPASVVAESSNAGVFTRDADGMLQAPSPTVAQQTASSWWERFTNTFRREEPAPAQNSPTRNLDQEGVDRMNTDGPVPQERQPRFVNRDVNNRDPDLVLGDEGRVVEPRGAQNTVEANTAGAQQSWLERMRNIFRSTDETPSGSIVFDSATSRWRDASGRFVETPASARGLEFDGSTNRWRETATGRFVEAPNPNASVFSQLSDRTKTVGLGVLGTLGLGGFITTATINNTPVTPGPNINDVKEIIPSGIVPPPDRKEQGPPNQTPPPTTGPGTTGPGATDTPTPSPTGGAGNLGALGQMLGPLLQRLMGQDQNQQQGTANPPVVKGTGSLANLTANPANVTVGGTTQLTWSSIGTTACVITSSGATETQIAQGGRDGSVTTSALSATTEFTLSCTTPETTNATARATVNVVPASPGVLFMAKPAALVSGSKTKLSWSTIGTNSCKVSKAEGGEVLAEGGKSGSTEDIVLTATTQFKLECTPEASGGAGKSALITVLVGSTP